MRWLKYTVPIFAFALLLAFSIGHSAFAVNPDEVLQNPKLEKRARELSTIIRCMKCQNQSIDDSNADLARDLRILVRDRLTKGDSDEEVLDYLVDRYGEFVLLKPRFSLSNLLLWIVPLFALIVGFILSWRMMQKRPPLVSEQANDLSSSEHEKLTKILNERD